MKDVLITINSTQNVDGKVCAGPELITLGNYDFAKDGANFSYMESEITGMTGTKTSFRVTHDEIVLSRNGTVNAQMVFRCGEHNRFLYRTEFGALTIGLDTRKLDCRLDEHGGDVEIEYALDFEHAPLSRNTFKINVREKELKS